MPILKKRSNYASAMEARKNSIKGKSRTQGYFGPPAYPEDTKKNDIKSDTESTDKKVSPRSTYGKFREPARVVARDKQEPAFNISIEDKAKLKVKENAKAEELRQAKYTGTISPQSDDVRERAKKLVRDWWIGSVPASWKSVIPGVSDLEDLRQFGKLNSNSTAKEILTTVAGAALPFAGTKVLKKAFKVNPRRLLSTTRTRGLLNRVNRSN